MTITEPDSHHHHDHHDTSTRSSSSWVGWLFASPVRVALLAVAAVLAVDAGGTDDGPGVCVFRRCTGGYCPGCGMTRAARHLTRGQVGAAWQDHPFVVLATGQAVVAALVYWTVRRIETSVDWNRVLVALGIFNLMLLCGIWVARLVDGSIPRFF